MRKKISKWFRQVIYRWYLKYIYRPPLAFFRMPGSKGFGILLIIFIMIVIGAVWDLNFNYINPETGETLDTFAAIYAVFALLVFETPLPLPDSWVTRLAFFGVPISGIFVLGQGLVRLGNVLLDKDAWSKAMASTYQEHTIVCGLGQVGLRVVRWILDLDEEAVVIESNPENPFLERVRGWGVPVVIADARRQEVLEEVNIKQAESIVPCTSDDLINLNIALQARNLVPNLKVVLRMVDAQLAENVKQGFNIHTVFSIPDIAAPAFAAAATKAPLNHAFAFQEVIAEDEEMGILTITKFVLVEESVLVGYTIKQLETEFDVAVIGHRHNGKFRLHPADNVVLSAGDRFVVSASIDALNRVARRTPPLHEMEYYRRGLWPIIKNK